MALGRLSLGSIWEASPGMHVSKNIARLQHVPPLFEVISLASFSVPIGPWWLVPNLCIVAVRTPCTVPFVN